VVKKSLQQLLGILILLGFLAGLLAIVFVPVEMSPIFLDMTREISDSPKNEKRTRAYHHFPG
jgi:hypothetical protein